MERDSAQVFIASGNSHKVGEFERMLGGKNIFIGTTQLLVDRLGGIPQEISSDNELMANQAAEDGSTFSENAEIKARWLMSLIKNDSSHYFQKYSNNILVLADDSGLCVTALGGAPGVFSARYAGENATDLANRKKLLTAMEGESKRAAHFACAIFGIFLRANSEEETRLTSGKVWGEISRKACGKAGFGYDPIFIPEEQEQGMRRTFAQMSPTEKNAISHRARALSLWKKSA